MSANIFIVFVALTYLPGFFLLSPKDSIVRGPSANDIYSEAPCELLPLSSFKDIQGNLWGIGKDNLWWFNSTNLSWSLLPMPNGTSQSAPWKVACVDPCKYVAVVGRNSTLVLHLPWQHWQYADTDDVNAGFIDRDATWCVDRHLFGVDAQRDVLYLLDSEEAHWTVRGELSMVSYLNWSTPHGLVGTWGEKDRLVILEKTDSHDHVAYTNTSAIDWIDWGENNSSDRWPDLKKDDHCVSVSFKLDADRLWLWKEHEDSRELWSFDGRWRRSARSIESRLPPLKNVLTGWKEGNKYCVLKRSAECTSQYTMSQCECWSEERMLSNDTDTPIPTPSGDTRIDSESKSTRKISPGQQKAKFGVLNYTSTPGILSIRPIPTAITSYKNRVIEPMKPKMTKYSHDYAWKNSPDVRNDEVVVVNRESDQSWHQHTSVFGSIIFFGTSITIFGLFGMFWCVRRCVHFPKEALLLRDPPSVRYTAIPDSLGYDSRRPTPSTYTVIPDSIA